MSGAVTPVELAGMVNDGRLVTCSSPCYGGATVDVEELALNLERYRLVWVETGEPIETYDLTDLAGAGFALRREAERWSADASEICIEKLVYTWQAT